MFGKVYGPYKNKYGKPYVLIWTCDNEGKILKKINLSYDKYVDEYNQGLHRYINPHTKILHTLGKTFVTKEVTCINCNKDTTTHKYNPINSIYFCSSKCQNTYKKKKDKINYHNQIVIEIKYDNEIYFILVERKEKKKTPVFIPKNKCICNISQDDNGVMRIILSYDRIDAVRIRPVPGYKKYFWITETGLLVSRRTKKVLSQTLSKTGYWTHATRIGGRNGQTLCFKIHRLVAMAFIPNPNNKPFINHINAVKTDNHYTNLEWCTNQENMDHAVAAGLMKTSYGEQVGTSKLSDNDVIHIRELYKTGNYTHRRLAEIYGVNNSTISDYINRRSYRHV